jgi:hypothetical protein
LRGERAFLTVYRGFLFAGINLHERSAVSYMLAGVNIDLGDSAIHFGHDDRRIARLERSDIFGSVLDRFQLGHFHFYRERLSSLLSRLCLSTAATYCGEKRREHYQ